MKNNYLGKIVGTAIGAAGCLGCYQQNQPPQVMVGGLPQENQAFAFVDDIKNGREKYPVSVTDPENDVVTINSFVENEDFTRNNNLQVILENATAQQNAVNYTAKIQATGPVTEGRYHLVFIARDGQWNFATGQPNETALRIDYLVDATRRYGDNQLPPQVPSTPEPDQNLEKLIRHACNHLPRASSADIKLYKVTKLSDGSFLHEEIPELAPEEKSPDFYRIKPVSEGTNYVAVAGEAFNVKAMKSGSGKFGINPESCKPIFILPELQGLVGQVFTVSSFDCDPALDPNCTQPKYAEVIRIIE